MDLDFEIKLGLIVGGHNPSDSQRVTIREATKKAEEIYRIGECGAKLFFNGFASVKVSNRDLEGIFLTNSLTISNRFPQEFIISSLESGRPGRIKHKFIIHTRSAPAVASYVSSTLKNRFEMYSARSQEVLRRRDVTGAPLDYETKFNFDIGKETEILYWKERMSDGETVDLFWKVMGRETGISFRRKPLPANIPDKPEYYHYYAFDIKSQANLGAHSSICGNSVFVGFEKPYKTSLIQKVFSNLPVTFKDGRNTDYVSIKSPGGRDIILFLNNLKMLSQPLKPAKR